MTVQLIHYAHDVRRKNQRSPDLAPGGAYSGRMAASHKCTLWRLDLTVQPDCLQGRAWDSGGHVREEAQSGLAEQKVGLVAGGRL